MMPPKTPSYKRSYVACLNCRARKARCILGSEPPCAKCQREHRDCVFERQERVGKRREGPRWMRTRNTSTGEAALRRSLTEADDQGHRRTPGNGAGDESSLADPVMSTVFTRPSDALDILFDAANTGQPANGSQNASVQGVVSESGQIAVSALSQPSDDVLDLWDKCRFVRQGWFTAQEAVTYLDLFHRYLAPLSPVLLNDYRNHGDHARLIMEEPMLCCTLLMISSRYFILPGAGGVSRSHFIHQRLWQYCELLIRRIMFGQEKHSTAKTRVVGSIESLILISDWHPRAVHFPPDTEGWDGELISPAYDRRNRLHTNEDVPLIRWREDVFEPARRSERMSWMLLGAATSLAYELGIFDGAGVDDTHLTARCHRAAQLLQVFVTQIAVKMGCSSLLPENISLPQENAEPVGDKGWLTCMKLWIELTELMKTASGMFFQSMDQIKRILGTIQYIIFLQQFAQSLKEWQQRFETTSDLPQALRPTILIEYHYLRSYTSALSIQAVVQRAIADSHATINNPSINVISSILPPDEQYIRDVVVSSRTVLEIATSMAAEGQLRYAPLRTLVCITSSSILLLKAISLGSRQGDLQVSLDTLDRCIAALRASGTDDMDFSLRYATLLEKHVARFRANFTHPDSSAQGFSTAVPGEVSLDVPNPVHQWQPQQPQLPTSNLAPRFTPTSTSGPQPTMGWSQAYTGLHQDQEEWWTLPFDPNIAPFSSHGHGNGGGVSLGLELDSLDFLWNLPLVDDNVDLSI